MKSQLLPSLSLFCLGAALLSVCGDTVVKMIDEDYSCCKIPEIKFDPKYEPTLIINGMVIGNMNRWIAPCTHIEPGRIVLNECLAVNVTMVLTNEHSVTEEEKRISFHGQLCPGSVLNKMAAGNQGLWLLAVVIAGLFVNVMIC